MVNINISIPGCNLLYGIVMQEYGYVTLIVQDDFSCFPNNNLAATFV